jgi:hypothetical protein
MKKNIWLNVASHPEIQIGQYIVPNFVSNSVAIKVNENEYILISPGASLLENWPNDLKQANCKIHIIMPNAWHFMGVKAWQEAFSDVTLYASALAKDKLIEKGAFTKSDNIQVLEHQQPPLPQGYAVLFPPGHRAGDAWVTKKLAGQCSWITCDSFLNYERLSNQPVARTMQKLLGAAPGLKMSQVVKWLILNDKKAFKSWVLEQLKKDNPTTLIPSHGEVTHDSHLKEKIESMVTSRL